MTQRALDNATHIGRYEVVGFLASGGMAEIVLGRIRGPQGFQRPVVIKRILPHLARQKDFVSMFVDEARIVAGIRHPNVIHVHELGNEDGNLFLVMEYLEGESLSGLSRRVRVAKEKLDYSLAAFIIAEACAGLHAAHELTDAAGNKQNVVHRDVSPQNVFVTYSGEVKVLDFGIAVAADRISRTEAGTFKGKFEYSSPEQCRGDALDRRSDVWALGVVLYEISTGTRLFKRNGQLDTMRAIVDQPVAPPKMSDPEYPEVLSKVVMRALERNRDKRYATALDMRRDLLAAMRTLSDDLAPEESLAALMRRLFDDRMGEKTDMLRRVQAGSEITELPAVETDMSVQIPVAYSDYPSAPPEGDAPEVHLPAPPRAAPAELLSGATPVGVPTVLEAPAPKKRNPGLLIVGVALGLTALVTAAWALSRPPKQGAISSASPAASSATVTATVTAETSSAPAMPTAPAPPASVVVRVETVPPKAHVFVGGSEAGMSPVDVKLPRGTDGVELEIRRDGYQTLRENVVPDTDQKLRFPLVAAPVQGTPAPRPTATPSPTPAHSGPKYPRFE